MKKVVISMDNNKAVFDEKRLGQQITVFPNKIIRKFMGTTKVILVATISDVSTPIPFTNVVRVTLNSGERVDLTPKDKNQLLEAISGLIK